MYRKRPVDSTVFPEKWRIVEEAIGCTFAKNVCRYSFQSIHHSVFQICQAKLTEVLLENLKESFHTQCQKIVRDLSVTEDDLFLEEFVLNWDDFSSALERIGGLLLYLKSHLLATHRSSVQEIGEHIFCTVVMKDNSVAQRLVDGVRCAVIDINKWDALRAFSKILMAVERGIFFSQLEDTYLDVVGSQHREEAKLLMESCTVAAYLRWSADIVARQEDQIANILSPASATRLTQYLLDVLIGEQCDYLLRSETGCSTMLQNWDYEGMLAVVTAFDRWGHVERVTEVLTRAIRDMAEHVVNNPNDNTDPVAGAERLVKKTLHLVKNCERLAKILPRNGNSSVETSPVVKAVCDVINSSEAFPDRLSQFYDVHIRRANAESIVTLTDEVLALFQVLRDRDSFDISFRNRLAARIMLAKSGSLRVETYFIERMKSECGTSAVTRLEKMITDIHDSVAMQERFQKTMASSRFVLPLDFRATVLTAGFWPQYPVLSFSIPHKMATCVSVFDHFYSYRHNGRKLVFQLGLGTVVYHLRHEGAKYTITAPTPFVCVLEAANSDGEVSERELSETMSLPLSDVSAQVAILQQYGLVVTTGSGGDRSFMFNKKFTSSSQKIRIGAGPQKITPEAFAHEDKELSIKKQQVLALESVIMRILKRSKTVEHDTLYQEVEEALQRVFSPTKVDIKERIDSLIEKGFLTRGDRSGLYVYCP